MLQAEAGGSSTEGVAESARVLPRVSIVVTTHRSPIHLLHCLHALMKQDLPRKTYEIVVVDCLGCARTREVVRTVARHCHGAPAVTYLMAGRGDHTAAARNLGWMYARASIIAFIDDNTLAEHDWLRHGVAAMTPNFAAVRGTRNSLSGAADTAPARGQSGAHAFDGANCFVHRRALHAVGGFDERFTAVRHEDADLSFRLMERYGGALRIGHEPLAKVASPRQAERWSRQLRDQRHLQFDALLRRKHPALYDSHLRKPPCWSHYGIVAALGVAGCALVVGAIVAGMVAVTLWSVLTARLSLIALQGSPATLARIGSSLATSITVPPVAVFWRCVGALRFRSFLP